jgi:hypothetical protein
MSFFDGKYETTHLERGESYGLSPRVYQNLAQAAISAEELCGIEPVLLEPIGGGGCVCTLYGQTNAYQIGIHTHPPNAPPIAVLKIMELDDPQSHLGQGDLQDRQAG